MPPSLPETNFRAGFMLALMAVLLVVLGMIASMVLMRQEQAAVWQPRGGGNDKLAAIQTAIQGFQASAGRLPCVAPRSAGFPNLAFDQEILNCAIDTTTAGVQGTARVELPPAGSGIWIRIGALPTRTLGLPEAMGEDEWGNQLSYAVTESLTDTTGFPAGVGRIRVVDAAGANLATNVSFILISHGADGKGAFSAKGSVMGKSCNSAAGLDQENCNNDTVFRDAELSFDPGASFFDDLVIDQIK
jgi:hypothetical protein